MRVSLLVLLVLSAAACDVGSVPPDEPGGTVDAAGGGGGGGGGSPDAATGGGSDGPAVACEPAAANLPNGEHRAGEACLTCHNGNGAPRFTLGGTLYTTLQGGTPIAGATILVTDANNVTTKLVTASNGNFYSNQAFAMPVKVAASKCPDTQPMIATATGDCNSCHQVGQSGRVHLP